MEVEYKWDLPDSGRFAEDPLIADALAGSETLDMLAIYYDTPGGLLSEKRVGLRVRRENGSSVCCMKTPAGQEGAAKSRNEYEVHADDIFEGLRSLPDAGAPAELCEMVLEQGVVPTCETDFTRTACRLQLVGTAGECTAELAFDKGVMRREGREGEICELELECIDGAVETFHEYAAALEGRFALRALQSSKLARALAL